MPASKARDRVVWIPYWSEEDSHRSILHLRNGLHHTSLAATIDILSQQGAILATRRVTLRKLENLDLRLHSIVPGTSRDEDRAGSIRISYRYAYEGVLQAELSIRDRARNHVYTIVAHKLRIEADTLTSAWLPAAPDGALVRAEYSLTSTEIIANAWLEDERTGFSNTALFHDEYPSSNTLYAAQLVAGGFPQPAVANSPRIDGVLTFVNVDSAPATLTPTLHCTADGEVKTITSPPCCKLAAPPTRATCT